MQRLLLSGLLFITITTAQADVQTIGNHRFTLPAGFTIELVAGPPLTSRPISADFDEKGRLYVTESSGTNDPSKKQLEDKPHSVLRLEDTNGDGFFDKRTVFADGLMFPEGALWHDGSLYITAPPSIWKLTDTNDDGVADRREEWFDGKTLGNCANDLHGPFRGRDGWIYWCKGAFAEQTYTFKGKEWKTRASHMFRCRPDGSGLEVVMTGGMDNPVDVAFLANGDRIFSTTFLVHPSNGQRDGLIHAIYGGVYGKDHGVLEGHPRTGDLMPVLVHQGPSAPCGLTCSDSEAFGPEYANNLYSCQFNLRKVSRHQVSPEGSSYKTIDHDFVVSDNHDFHPTDVFEDADGSILVVDTGGWYKLCCPTSQLHKPDILGGIYRIRKTGMPKVADPRGTAIDWKKLSLAQVAELFKDSRFAVRNRAILEFGLRKNDPGMTEFLDNELWAWPVFQQEEFVDLKHSLDANLSAEWACIQVGGEKAADLLARACNHPRSIYVQVALQGMSLHKMSCAGPLGSVLAPNEDPTVARLAVENIGRGLDPHWASSINKATHFKTTDRALEHAMIYALIEIGNEAVTRKHLVDLDVQVRRVALMALDQMPGRPLLSSEVLPLLNSNESLLRETANWIVARRPEWGAELTQWAQARLAKLTDVDGTSRTQIEEVLRRHLAHPAMQELLAKSASGHELPTESRRFVIEMMGQLGAPMPPAWADAFADLLKSDATDLSAAAVSAVRRLPPGKTPTPKLNEALITLAAKTKAGANVRLEAIAAAAAGSAPIDAELFELLLPRLSTSTDEQTRSVAADALTKAKLSTPQLDRLCQTIEQCGPLELDRLLAPFERSKEDALGLKLLASLKRAKALPSLRIDSLKQRLGKYGQEVQQGIEDLHASLNVDLATQRKRIEDLLPQAEKGDIRRGQAIFNQAKSNCVVCHKFGHVGGLVGPDLTRIGRIRQERDLLESILYPSLSFVRSYEPIVVLTTDGRTINGQIKSETGSELVLVTGPNQEARVRIDEIEGRRPGTVSIMPAGLDKQLTDQELVDLVAFLKNAK